MGMDIRNILKLLLNSTRCYFVPNVIHEISCDLKKGKFQR